MEKLTSSQRKYLRGLAHHFEPIVIIGINGLSESLVKAIDSALEDHELIKIKFNKFKEDKKAMCLQIEEKTNSNIVGLVGNVAIVFRQNTEKEKQKIFFD